MNMSSSKRIWILSVVLCSPVLAQENQSQTFEWDLTEIYQSVADWEHALERVNAQIEALNAFSGTLGDSSSDLLAAMRAYSDANKEAARVYAYTSLDRDADQREPGAQARFGLSRQMFTNLGQATAWINPELLAVGESKVNSYIEQEPRLGDFEFHFRDVFRQAATSKIITNAHAINRGNLPQFPKSYHFFKILITLNFNFHFSYF